MRGEHRHKVCLVAVYVEIRILHLVSQVVVSAAGVVCIGLANHPAKQLGLETSCTPSRDVNLVIGILGLDLPN